MRPRERSETGEQDLFRSRLDQIIDMKHRLVTGPHGGLGAPGRAVRLRRLPALDVPFVENSVFDPL